MATRKYWNLEVWLLAPLMTWSLWPGWTGNIETIRPGKCGSKRERLFSLERSLCQIQTTLLLSTNGNFVWRNSTISDPGAPTVPKRIGISLPVQKLGVVAFPTRMISVCLQDYCLLKVTILKNLVICSGILSFWYYLSCIMFMYDFGFCIFGKETNLHFFIWRLVNNFKS